MYPTTQIAHEHSINIHRISTSGPINVQDIYSTQLWMLHRSFVCTNTGVYRVRRWGRCFVSREPDTRRCPYVERPQNLLFRISDFITNKNILFNSMNVWLYKIELKCMSIRRSVVFDDLQPARIRRGEYQASNGRFYPRPDAGCVMNIAKRRECLSSASGGSRFEFNQRRRSSRLFLFSPFRDR